MRHWRCISGCGACCRLDPAERGEDLAALSPAQQHAYLQMVGADGWCIHFDTGGRRCRIYEDRPDFCRVENLLSLFGKPDAAEAAAADPAAAGPAQVARAEALAIQSCRQQIRAEYGGRGRVMRRFERAIRRP
jgi:Fe-S-cluster containining protein